MTTQTERIEKRETDVLPNGNDTSKHVDKNNDEVNDMDVDEDQPSDSDTVILDTEQGGEQEDLEIINQDELFSPPPKKLSPLPDNSSFLKFRYQVSHLERPVSGSLNVSMNQSNSQDMSTAMGTKTKLVSIDETLERSLDGFDHVNSEDRSFPGSTDALKFRLQKDVFERRTMKRYMSEPSGETGRKNVLAYTMNNKTLFDKFNNMRLVKGPQTEERSTQASTNHPCFCHHGNKGHMPKFLRKRKLRKMRTVENEPHNLMISSLTVAHPCFHPDCSKNHIPKFLRKRYLRQQNTTTDSKEVTVKDNKSTLKETLGEDYDLNMNSKNIDKDLEERINKLRKQLIRRQKRMQVLQEVLYRRKPKGVFMSSLMHPKHRIFHQKYQHPKQTMSHRQ